MVASRNANRPAQCATGRLLVSFGMFRTCHKGVTLSKTPIVVLSQRLTCG